MHPVGLKLFLNLLIYLWLSWQCLKVLGRAVWHFMPCHHFTWIQVKLEMIASFQNLSVPACHRLNRDSSLRGRQRALPGATTSTADVTSHHAPWCHTVYPQAFLHPLWCKLRGFHCSRREWALVPFPQKTVDCYRWTAGLNRYVKSHVNLKNIKMITSSRVTFLFIYRISQLCMTNFAQSHYLEQFV